LHLENAYIFPSPITEAKKLSARQDAEVCILENGQHPVRKYRLKGTQSALGHFFGHWFSHFGKSPPQPEIKDTCQLHLEIRFNLCSVLLDFLLFTEKPVFECAFAHFMILFYQIWLKTVWVVSL